MILADFIRKWERSELKESAAAQSHFNDLCDLLEVEKPTDADAVGDTYCFEKGATKSTGGNGFADVWKKGCFGWEYKGPKANLDVAYAQLQRYAVALENPPLLIVSDTKTIIIRTNWTNTVSETHTFALADLVDAKARETLKNCFLNPEALRPKRTRDDLTREAANDFSALAQRLRDAGHDAETVAHFVNRLVFCMFAEDVGLLPNKMFERAIEHARKEPEKAQDFLKTLFAAMKSGGPVGFESVPWFNGGLFNDDEALPLGRDEIELVYKAAKLFWADIDPSILGTLFERGLDPSKRSQLGAHYTDRDKIMMIIRPVIIEPLDAEWAEAKAKIIEQVTRIETAKSEIATIREQAAKEFKATGDKGREAQRQQEITNLRSTITRADNKAKELHTAFTDRLSEFRVLDPACGSGNFLYLSLKALKDIEHRANVEFETFGFARRPPKVGPEAVKGIEINPYAAELARVSVWIGEIQWMRANGFEATTNPILKPLDNIECRDAVLNPDGTETSWPDADVIVGNPPFLGAKLMKRMLGVNETERLRNAFSGRLPGFTDLVCYWFEKGREKIERGHTVRVGLVATNSIRKNTNLPVLKRISETTHLFEAWSEERWTIEGAAVDVSLICFGREDRAPRLNGRVVDQINPDLSSGLDLTSAAVQSRNNGGAFLGIQKSGPFDIAGPQARRWLMEPSNPNGRKNSEVLKPYWNGDDVTARPRDIWFIDLPLNATEAEASLFELPFAHIAETRGENGKTVKELRAELGDRAGPRWWEPHWPRPEMRSRIEPMSRYIVTPETAQYRLFVWLRPPVLPDKNLIVIPRDDDTFFGLLQSKMHELWSLRKGSDLQDRPRYTHTSTFATFPFPEGLTPDIPAADYANDPRAQAIARAAARLNELRENWLNPPDLVKRVPEVVPGYPDRILPVDERAADILKKRTLTNLYNERPAWLAHAHRDLDRAVAAAYGWQADYDGGTLTEDEILKRLFELNQARSMET